MNYDEAVFAWAEGRLALPKGSVTKVKFGTEEEGYCDTCAYTVGGVDVHYNVPNKKNKNGISTKYGFIDLHGDSFTDVLAQIIEAGA